MTPRDIILHQLAYRETDPVPYTIDFEQDVEERLNEYYGSTEWRERLTKFIVSYGEIPTMQRIESGSVFETDMFGSVWRVDQRPCHLEKPAMKEPSFDDYELPPPEKFYVTDLTRTARESRQEFPDSFSAVWIPWGLWETSWGLRGFENALIDCIAEEDFYEELMERLTELFLAHVERCAEIDADGIMFGDDWGDQRGVIIGPDRWRRFMKPRYEKIYSAVHAQGKYVMSHCCGSAADIMEDLIEIGLDVIESVQPEAEGMNPYELKKKWGGRITFWGCLGSQSTLPFGTPEEVSAEVRSLCRQMGKGGGYILAPAKTLQPETPTQNAVAAVEAFISQK